MINELKERLTALGLSDEMTDKVIATVAEFAKNKLPDKIHPMLDDLMAGKKPDLGFLGGLLGGFKNPFS